ncbi:MAG: signal transduction protein [Pseudomonadota bacterium]
MKILALACAALMFTSSALAEEKTEGRLLAELAFDSVDSAGRDFIDMGEFIDFGMSVFAGMDYDDNDKITLREFMDWDIGMQPIAEQAGRADAYDTALRVVFAFWDRDGDKEISKTDYRRSMSLDFQRADFDNNAILTKDEFTGGFSLIIAMRAAINPAPVE